MHFKFIEYRWIQTTKKLDYRSEQIRILSPFTMHSEAKIGEIRKDRIQCFNYFLYKVKFCCRFFAFQRTEIVQ